MNTKLTKLQRYEELYKKTLNKQLNHRIANASDLRNRDLDCLHIAVKHEREKEMLKHAEKLLLCPVRNTLPQLSQTDIAIMGWLIKNGFGETIHYMRYQQECPVNFSMADRLDACDSRAYTMFCES
jgi:hypothetical protein